MDQLLGHLPELVAAGTAAWQWRRARRANAAKVALEAAKAALEQRLEAVADIGERFAAALLRRDYAQLKAIERERKARGL